jgi:hypothetical protein
LNAESLGGRRGFLLFFTLGLALSVEATGHRILGRIALCCWRKLESPMAKKLNKLAARIAALEKTVTEFFSGAAPKTKRKARKVAKPKAKKAKVPAKAAKRVKKVALAAKSAAARKSVKVAKAKTVKKAKKKTVAKAPAVSKPAKRVARKRIQKVAPPTLDQLAPSGAPEFVSPHDQV